MAGGSAHNSDIIDPSIMVSETPIAIFMENKGDLRWQKLYYTTDILTIEPTYFTSVKIS